MEQAVKIQILHSGKLITLSMLWQISGKTCSNTEKEEHFLKGYTQEKVIGNIYNIGMYQVLL